MTGLTPESTPLTPIVIDVNSWPAWFGLLLGLTLVGLLLTAIYLTLIAAAIVKSEDETISRSASGAGFILHWSGRTWLRFGALALLYLVLVMVIILPISLVAAVIALLSQLMATLILLAAPVILLWVTIFLSFVPQGMVFNRKPFFPSLAESVRLFQTNLIPALSLLLVVIVSRQVLSWLLLAADTGTWFTLASILGHAFVSTALSAAMLIFYRDRYRLLPDSTIPNPTLETVNL